MSRRKLFSSGSEATMTLERRIFVLFFFHFLKISVSADSSFISPSSMTFSGMSFSPNASFSIFQLNSSLRYLNVLSDMSRPTTGSRKRFRILWVMNFFIVSLYTVFPPKRISPYAASHPARFHRGYYSTSRQYVMLYPAPGPDEKDIFESPDSYVIVALFSSSIPYAVASFAVALLENSIVPFDA